jgi:hypothetical protein
MSLPTADIANTVEACQCERTCTNWAKFLIVFIEKPDQPEIYSCGQHLTRILNNRIFKNETAAVKML